LVNCRLGKPLFYFDEVTSTNDVLREKAVAGAPEGSTVIAGTQTAGRGRRGKKWLSVPGKGVYLSLLLRPRWPATESPYIAFFAALAAARTLERFNIGAVKLKWPNDLLVNGKKIGGVLIEPRIHRGLLEFIVVGIGINVTHNRDDLNPLGEKAATSCLLEGADISCDDVIINLLAEFDICYYMIQHGDKKAIIDEWSQRGVKSRSQKAEGRGQRSAVRSQDEAKS
jgi:BirA family biotin operon repressor/biotin-[acetyl-CoA-carboxylase] ligase